MRFLRQALTGVFLLSLTVALLAIAAALVLGAVRDRMADEQGGPPAAERAYAAEIMEVVPETITPILSTFGAVEAGRSLTVRSDTAGRILEMSPAMREGGKIGEGELLVRIDPADASAALDMARVDLSGAEADLQDARAALALSRDDLAAAEEQVVLRDRGLERQRDLAARGVGATTGVEDAELSASTARQAVLAKRQAVREAQATLARAETELARRRIEEATAARDLAATEIRAPFAGILSEVTVSAGALVSQNEAVAELLDPDALEVAFRISTAQYGRLAEGAGPIGRAVDVSLDVLGVDLTATGEIVRQSGAVGEGETGRRLYAALDEAEGFRPGDFVTVEIAEPPLDEVARLPAAALGPKGDVLVVGEENRLQAAPVELLRRQGDNVIVDPGPVAGAEIVAARSPLLGDGIRIDPVSPEGGDAGDEAADAEPAMLELSDERRARLVAFVEGGRMPDAAKARVLAQLQEPQVPIEVVERIEARMGG